MLVKQVFEQQLSDAIQRAFSDAMKSSVLGDQNPQTKAIVDKMAEKFGQSAAESLSGALADAITDYIKSASVTVTAAPQVGLASPSGPVTGVVNIQPTFVTIS